MGSGLGGRRLLGDLFLDALPRRVGSVAAVVLDLTHRAISAASIIKLSKGPILFAVSPVITSHTDDP